MNERSCTSASETSVVEALAEDFLDRKRRGERPTVAEYAAQYPHLADEIRAFFPVLGLVEDYKPGAGDVTGSLAAGAVTGGAVFARLGDYQILREVGRGGMGVVYEAEQVSLGRRVALKVLTSPNRLDPKLVSRFERKAKAAARLHHTNIVPVFGVGEAEGVHYYVMQFIQGLGLDQVLEAIREPIGGAARPGNATATGMARSLEGGRLASAQDHEPSMTADGGPAASAVALPGPTELSAASDSAGGYPRSVARIGQQAAEALAYAHEQGILHRDIKPSNLLLDAHGIVWVADFGLAKVASDSDLTHTGDLVGTLRYMAPERFQGRCDARSDVYALGLTLYEMLARCPAFAGKDKNALIRAVTEAEPMRLRTLDRSLPRDLETIVHKAIEREPAHRYASASLLAEDLRRFVEDRPIAARPISTAERLVRWGRRNPLAGGLSAALVALLVLLAAGSTLAAVRVARSEQRAVLQARTAVAAAVRAMDARDAAAAARTKLEAANASLRAAQDDLRRTVYAARMNLAQTALEAGNAARTASWLDLTRPRGEETDFRGFEWYYWSRQLHDERSSLRLPRSSEPAWALSGDGARAAAAVPVAGNRTDLVVLDTRTLRPLFTYPVPTRTVVTPLDWPLVLNRDGTRLAEYVKLNEPAEKNGNRPGVQGTLRVWEVDTGRLLFTHQDVIASINSFASSIRIEGSKVARLAWTFLEPPGAAGGRESDLVIWDADTGRELLHQVRQTPQQIRSVIFQPDGAALCGSVIEQREPISETTSTLLEWDLANRQERAILGRYNGHVFPMAFSPDKTRLAVVRRAMGTSPTMEGMLTVLDAATGAELFTLRDLGPIPHAPAWSPDGRMLAAGNDDASIKLYDATSGRSLRVLHGHAGALETLAFRPEGGGLVSLDYRGTLKEWDLGAHPLVPAGAESLAQDVAAAELGGAQPWVALAGPNSEADPWTITVRDATSGREKGRFTFPRLGPPSPVPPRLLVSGDGATVACLEVNNRKSSEQRLTVGDVAAGRIRLQLNSADMGGGLPRPPFPRPYSALALRGDGEVVALGVVRPDRTREVQLRDTNDGHVLAHWAAPGVSVLAFSHDGRAVAGALVESRAGAPRGIVRVWASADGSLLHNLEGNTAGFETVAFSPDGSRMAACVTGETIVTMTPSEVLIWDLRHPESAPRRLGGIAPGYPSLTFSPDSERIATLVDSGKLSDCEWRLWDAATGQELLSQSPEVGAVGGLRFDPDGRRIRLVSRNIFSSSARITVWNAGPLPDRLEAALLVERLAADKLTGAEVRAAVAAEPSLTGTLRAAAFAQAETWPQDRPRLLATAVRITNQPAAPADEYRLALSYADAAVAMFPDEEEGRYVRGLARLRAGQFETARDDLEASAQAGGDPASWGLLALAEIRLGHRAAAGVALGRMTQLVSAPGFFSRRSIPGDLKREAESLIHDPNLPNGTSGPGKSQQ